jgi:hypothetical protein
LYLAPERRSDLPDESRSRLATGQPDVQRPKPLDHLRSRRSVFRWRVQDAEAFYIVVFDITGRAGDFAWAGEEWDLTDQDIESFLERVQGLAASGQQRINVSYPSALRPRRTADGRWVMPRPQG